jgi:hypothetical protein
MKIRRGCGRPSFYTLDVSRGDTVRVAIPATLIAIQLSVPALALAQQPERPTPRNAPRDFTVRLNSLDPADTASVPVARGEAEDAFRAFWAFYRAVVRVHDASIDTPPLVELLMKLCEARDCGPTSDRR